jgi:oligogalacturonide lyase
MIYVSYRKDERERWICSLNPVTLEDRRLMAMPACSHLMSNEDGTLVVGDGCDGDPFLHVFDIGQRTSRRVAHHDSSWRVYKGNRQVTHPHPSFTPDQRQVLFSADGDGEPGLYLVDVPAP